VAPTRCSKTPVKESVFVAPGFPEEDPLMMGLQGVDTVIEHFIKNAQAQGGSNNSALLEHIEEVRRSQVAVCQTAQLVQEQVAQLVASRAQLEAHRSTLHHHLAAITSLIASNTNHTSTATSANVPTTVGNSHSTVSSGSAQPVPVTTETANEVYSLPLNNCTTSTATTATNTNPSIGHPLPLTTTTSVVSAHPITAVINRSLQSFVPTASVMSWAGLTSPFLASTNIALSLEGKDGVFYSHLTPKDSAKESKPLVTSVSTLKPNHRISPHGNNKTPTTRHGSNKSHKQIIDNVNTTPVKFNGIPTGLPKHIFKPLQTTGPIVNTTMAKKATKTVTYSQPSPISGLPQPSVALVSPSTTVTSQNGLTPLPVIHNANSNKNGRTSKPQIGFTPYAKTSPTK
ncbi:hypothetical protein SK128_005648, partial [Halocaridina rubra]